MSFIEPFAPLYHDYIENAVVSGVLGGFAIGTPEANLGYTSIQLGRSADISKVFGGLQSLYVGMKQEYEYAANVYTDRTIDPATERYIPRSLEQRHEWLEAFLQAREGFYSPKSIEILRYLAEHIQQAEPRGEDQPFDMSSTAMMYITRGFAGGMTFAFAKNEGTVRLDLMPRVITTSAVAKSMLGQDAPTTIIKTDNPATDEEKAVAQEYHRRVRRILQDEPSSNHSYSFTALET